MQIAGEFIERSAKIWISVTAHQQNVFIISRVVPDTYLAGYPAAGYPANNFAG